MSYSKDNPIWQVKSVDETLQMYADWAEKYDEDVGAWGYATPQRIASALKRHLVNTEAPILDFGCGTGLSGVELAKEGYTNIDGTDISPEMLEGAYARGVYRNLFAGKAGEIAHEPGKYEAITAMGVITAGAAPPETLRPVLESLATGGLLALSYNDATLPDQRYMDALATVLKDGTGIMIFDEYGPHLPKKGMKSRVYIIEKT